MRTMKLLIVSGVALLIWESVVIMLKLSNLLRDPTIRRSFKTGDWSWATEGQNVVGAGLVLAGMTGTVVLMIVCWRRFRFTRLNSRKGFDIVKSLHR